MKSGVVNEDSIVCLPLIMKQTAALIAWSREKHLHVKYTHDCSRSHLHLRKLHPILQNLAHYLKIPAFP